MTGPGIRSRITRGGTPGWERLSLGLIVGIGAALRLYGVNWDGGQWLHPDERQVYFLVNQLSWPRSLAEAWSPDSPLNPRFFAYGSLPLYLLKLVATLVGVLIPALRHPDNLHLIGRPLAAILDLGTVYLTYRLARGLMKGDKGAGVGAPLLAASLVSLAVLHIQQAHFYTVDPLLTFLVMLTLNLAMDVAQGGGWGRRIGLGAALGMALATKTSAFPLVLTVCAAHQVWGQTSVSRSPSPMLKFVRTLLTLAVAIAVFFFTQPYALIDWQTFLDHTLREAQIARGLLEVPYILQYSGTWPFIYSMWQTALWGLGIPVGVMVWAGLAALLIRWLRYGRWADTLLISWAGLTFLIIGLSYTRYLRYMLPLTPVLCVTAVQLLEALKDRALRQHRGLLCRRVWTALYVLLPASSLSYALAFTRIYATPHSLITASEWIYRHIPTESTLAVEHWDVALPLPLEIDGVSWQIGQYQVRTLPLYDEPDNETKWQALVSDLAASDYLILSSRRLYGSISRRPDRYPIASRYYSLLFGGNLGFECVAEFTRGPTWLNPRAFPLSNAAPPLLLPDESFVVYDHPRVLIFRNRDHLPADELMHRLRAP